MQAVALLTILPGVISTEFCQVVKESSGRILLERARWCNTFGRRLRGLTFRRALAPGEGLILVEKEDSRVNAGITMAGAGRRPPAIRRDELKPDRRRSVAHPYP